MFHIDNKCIPPIDQKPDKKSNPAVMTYNTDLGLHLPQYELLNPKKPSSDQQQQQSSLDQSTEVGTTGNDLFVAST